jgi:hypothetical protein
MRTALSRRHGWTLAVLLVAAIVTLATVRLSASDAQAPTHSAAQLAHRSVPAAAYRSVPTAAYSSAPTVAHRTARASVHRAGARATLKRRTRTATPHPTLHVPRAGRRIRTLTGDGPGAIGSLRERRAAVLQWHTSQGPFQIYTSRGLIIVSGRGHRGSIGLTRGDYNNLRVSTPGVWTIRLSRRR